MENQQTSPIQPKISNLSSINDLFKRAWQIYKERLGTFLGIVILSIISGFLILFPLEILTKTIKISPIFGIFLLFVFRLVMGFLSLWSTASLLFAIKDRKEKIGILESYRRALSKIIPFIWISILTGFFILGGFCFFIIPGVIFFVWFMFGSYVLVWEDKRGMDAIFRSKQLVSGNWWKVFWRLLIISLPFLLIGLIAELFKIPFFGIVGYIPALFLAPFGTIFLFLIYDDLKKLKEGIPFEPPKRETKIKYILLIGLLWFLIPGILVLVVLTSLRGTRNRARDIVREADMRQFLIAQEIYHEDREEYYNSKDQDGLPAIPPNLLKALDDPEAPHRHYKWLDNTSCPQHYCAYAILENKENCSKNRYLVVSEKGTKEICDIPPINGCSCW